MYLHWQIGLTEASLGEAIRVGRAKEACSVRRNNLLRLLSLVGAVIHTARRDHARDRFASLKLDLLLLLNCGLN